MAVHSHYTKGTLLEQTNTHYLPTPGQNPGLPHGCHPWFALATSSSDSMPSASPSAHPPMCCTLLYSNKQSNMNNQQWHALPCSSCSCSSSFLLLLIVTVVAAIVVIAVTHHSHPSRPASPGQWCWVLEAGRDWWCGQLWDIATRQCWFSNTNNMAVRKCNTSLISFLDSQPNPNPPIPGK